MLSLGQDVAVRPRLVIAIGNPSRGDDALGPLAAQRIEALALDDVEVLTDFQLQIEYALDLRGRREVIFIDACVDCDAPYRFAPLEARADASITTHALSPAALLDGYRRLTGEAPPVAYVLAIRGESFELGDDLSDTARASLAAGVAALQERLRG